MPKNREEVIQPCVFTICAFRHPLPGICVPNACAPRSQTIVSHQTAHIHSPHKTECHLSSQFCTSNLTPATVLSRSWHNLPRMWSKSRKVTKVPHPVRATASAKMKEPKRHPWEKKRLCWSMDYFRERVCWERNITRAPRVPSCRKGNQQEEFPATVRLHSS